MNWDRYSSVMEQYAIKTDVIASQDDYFMATHMPFSNLEVITGGNESGSTKLMTEEEVYQNLIYNPENIHRLIIVRGNNGAGKSHLIRWLRARYNNDSVKFNPENDKIIFLRRLNNTIRGAISQILEENIITDTDMNAKLQKFIDSADAQDSDTFKTTIYHAFINLVANDKSGKVYKPFVCKGIQDFLYDPRVRVHLMRDDGAINRCYKAITSPSDTVFEGEATFNEEDFTLKRTIMQELLKQGSTESKDFAEQIYDNPDEIQKFVKYLNQFTSKVIQSCAEISSDSTRDVFVQLRKSLKQQGKGLTIFIEDFTAFTGIDSELITVLSAEHGGENSDLCRVTAIIGITDAYYGQFKDNFTDRVQYQVNVTESTYNTAEFLETMTSLYLNAIYCEPRTIQDWFASGADLKRLPTSGFKPGYSWDYVLIDNTPFTLYPFNKSSLSILYGNLKSKTPRKFLTEAVKSQLKEFFDGQQYGNFKFPTGEFIADIASNSVQMNAVHASYIDSQNDITASEKRRLKLVLAIWGNKTAETTESDNETYIGNVAKKFLDEIGFEAARGLTTVTAKSQEPTPTLQLKPIPSPAPVVIPQKQRQYEAKKHDITAWYSEKSEIAYSADYRKWFLEFLRDAINWQAEGIPAYIAASRLQEQSTVYIEGQSQSTLIDKALIILERNNETRDILHALCDYDYYGGWLFKEAAYYQLKLVNWLEKNKSTIKAKVCNCDDSANQWPVLQWCIAVEYIVSNILGRSLDLSNDETLARDLFAVHDLTTVTSHASSKWSDVVQYIRTNSAKFTGTKTLMVETAKTFMGTITTNYTPPKVSFYRTLEISKAIENLQESNWDISDTLPPDTKTSIILSPADLLKELYPRVNSIVRAEMDQAKSVIDKLKNYLGGEISEDSIIDTLNAVSEMYAVFNANKIQYNSAMRAKFDIAPKEKAKTVLCAYDLVEEASSSALLIRKLKFLSTNPVEVLSSLLSDLIEIERIALEEKNTADAEMKRLTGGIDLTAMTSDSIEYLSSLADKVERMGAISNVD